MAIRLNRMTLVTRLSLFFLTALALVLVGMSASIYAIVRSHLLHEVSERFDDTFETLTQVAKFGTDGVQLDPTDRRLDFGHDPAGDTAAWQVVESNGHLVGISDEGFSSLFAGLPASVVDEPLQQDLPWRGRNLACFAPEGSPGNRSRSHRPAIPQSLPMRIRLYRRRPWSFLWPFP